MRKSIALVSPHYPPTKGGVSDYTHKLATTFRHQGIKTIVITEKKNQFHEQSDQTDKHVFQLSLPFSAYKVQDLLEKEKITDVIIQYTPRPFHPTTNGVGLSLINIIIRLRKKFRVHLYTHESNFPVNLTLPGLILGPLHSLQYYLLAILSHKVMFSTTYFKNRWAKKLFFKKHDLKVVPIGSNILPPQDNPTSSKKKQIVFFASNHPTCLKETVAKSIELIHENFPEYNFVVLGVKDTDFQTKVPKSSICYPGHLSEEEISDIYNESIASICAFLDGCSSRRGTLLASLAHNVPVFTNIGFSSQGDIPWRDICLIPESGEANDLPEFVVNTLKSTNILEENRKTISKYFRQYFSWSAVSKSLLTHID